MTRKIIWLLTAAYALLFAGIEQAAAVPAYPHPITYTQSDGTRITIRIIGDEYYNYVLSSDGYTLVGGPKNDYYYATLGNDGNLTATSVMAKPSSQLSPEEKQTVSTLVKGLKPISTLSPLKAPRVMQAPGMLMSSVGDMEPPIRISTGETKGKLRSLIILIQFSDTKYITPNPKTAFNRMLNEPGYSDNNATGSAWDYYHDNSNGLFDPQFEIVGPYTVSGPAKYYAGSEAAGYTQRAGTMIKEACDLAAADGVDFSQYATDGIVRDIFVFYAGHNRAEGGPNSVWPHRSDLKDWNITVKHNEVQVRGYACSSELNGASGTTMANIGTFCHEFGHVLGWPDLYDSDYGDSGGAADGLENYSLMCQGSYNNGGRTPPALNILERWMVGWAEPEEFAATQTYEMGSIVDNKGFLIPSRTGNEYFLAEYRGTNKNVWDNPQHIGDATGMIVYHVDYSISYANRWSADFSKGGNTVNVDPRHECMKLVRSVPSSKKNAGRTFFPGSTNATSLLPTTNSLYNAWNGEEPLVLINDISLGKDKITVNVTRLGGPSIGLKTEPYQHDILLTWTDSQSKSWGIVWKDGQGNTIGSTTVETPKVRLENLQPATSYEVHISGRTSDGEDWTRASVVTTKSRSGSNPHLGFEHSEFKKDAPILLTLMDYKGTIKEVQWFIDGKQTTSTYAALPVGEHEIKAVIVTEKTKEYLIKYITVKE